jgi:hypothetical protein
MKHNVFTYLLATLILLAYALLPVAADCCYSDGNHCDDGTYPTPCCGYGKWYVCIVRTGCGYCLTNGENDIAISSAATVRVAAGARGGAVWRPTRATISSKLCFYSMY